MFIRVGLPPSPEQFHGGIVIRQLVEHVGPQYIRFLVPLLTVMFFIGKVTQFD